MIAEKPKEAEKKGEPGEFQFKSNLPVDMQIADAGGWTKANLRPSIENVGGSIDVNTEMASLAKNQIHMFMLFTFNVLHLEFLEFA